MQRHAKTIRPASFGEQLLSTLDVEILDLEVWRRAKQEIGNELPRRHGLAFHHARNDRLAVDRLRQRLAHARIEQRIFIERMAVLVGDKRRYGAIAVEMNVDQTISDLPKEAEVAILL